LQLQSVLFGEVLVSTYHILLEFVAELAFKIVILWGQPFGVAVAFEEIVKLCEEFFRDQELMTVIVLAIICRHDLSPCSIPV
jgi:hypothetical protein